MKEDTNKHGHNFRTQHNFIKNSLFVFHRQGKFDMKSMSTPHHFNTQCSSDNRASMVRAGRIGGGLAGRPSFCPVRSPHYISSSGRSVRPWPCGESCMNIGPARVAGEGGREATEEGGGQKDRMRSLLFGCDIWLYSCGTAAVDLII